MKYKRYISYFIPYGIVFGALVIASLYDYEIAQYLYHPNSIFGILFERILLIFVIYMLPFGFYGLYRIHKKKRWLFCFMLSIIYWVIDMLHYWISIKMNMYIVIGFIAVVLWISYQLLNCIPISFFQRYEQFIKFFLLVFLSAMAITIMCKLTWGRVRYREMLDNVSLFTPWYFPQGNTGHTSFPSGHTTAMSSILCFFEIHRVKSAMMPRNRILCSCIVLLLLAMMISRMIMGAHFLSDVSVGFSITYTMYLFWKRKIYWEVMQ